MKSDPIFQATVRFAGQQLLSLIPMVLLWALVLGVADMATMLVLWIPWVACASVVWYAGIEPFRRPQTLELGDRELLALDESMARAPARFGRNYNLVMTSFLLGGSLLGLVGLPRAIEFGTAELIAAVMFMPTNTILILMAQASLWEPLEPIRAKVSAQLSRRRLLDRRTFTTRIHSALIRGGLLTIAMFASTAGFAGVRHTEDRRLMAQAEQAHLAELAAQEVRTTGVSTVEGVGIVDEAELPVALRDGERATRSAIAVEIGNTAAFAAAPIGDGRWAITDAEVDEGLSLWFGLSIIISACLVMPVMGPTLANASSLMRQLVELGKAIREVGQTGKIRDVARVVPLRNDEVDTLFNDFNDMLDMLDELTDAASKVASGDLRNQLERPGDLHDAFRAMVERLHAMVVQIRSTSLDLASAASEIHSITQEQERAVNQQSLRMREVSDTVASLASSAESITRTSADVLDNADQTLRTTNAMILRIGELGAQAASVGQLLDLIREIADRSDLLALNGSLEATRVGEAGRGFALVAAEMRRLAERVTQTVGDVRERVVEIKTAGSNTVVVAEDSRKLAEQTASAARQISQVTHRQSRETELAAQTVHEITGVVIATAGATSQTRAAAEGLREQAERLERLTRQFTLGANGS
ncbi:methyl-accepting chemotaxis protein [Nannocystaceae bacterium ST9]